MALEMRTECERCGSQIGHTDAAFICSYECTWCPNCTESFSNICPNCSGELVSRPTRLPKAT
ncbi:MAG: DUF1272 domain-containing protein [Chloroflexi bacterium]|nr:DUF1272 domain-containing protein [Chloroflexota bacterium]